MRTLVDGGRVLRARAALLRHAPALVGAAVARVGAFAAMVQRVFAALVGARFADVGAQLAQRIRVHAAARHVADRRAADVGAIHVERNAVRQALRVGLGETRGGAVVTRGGAAVAGFDAGAVVLEGHVGLLKFVLSGWSSRSGQLARPCVDRRSVEAGGCRACSLRFGAGGSYKPFFKLRRDSHRAFSPWRTRFCMPPTIGA